MQSDDLKDAGLKATQPRLKILSILEQNRDRHMSAEDVYRALMAVGDDLGLATIYRVLTQFESAGLVIRTISRRGTRCSSSTRASTMTTSCASTAGR